MAKINQNANESKLNNKEIVGWFSNRTGTSFDDGKARGKD